MCSLRAIHIAARMTLVMLAVATRAAGQCLLQEFTAANPTAGDRFGWWVDVDGDHAVIGVPWDDDGCLVCDPDCDTGSAFVYRLEDNVWVQEAKLSAPNAVADEWFGNPVHIDGDVIVLGARGDCEVTSRAGAVFVYRRTGTDWVMDAKLTASDGDARDYLGTSAAIDGDVILAGSPSIDCAAGESCGAVYVFRHNGSEWVEEAKLTASDGSRIGLGISVALEGNRFVAGAWFDDHGGAHTNAGSAYVFSHDGVGWVEEARLVASDPEEEDRFGFAVDLSGDSIIVGSVYDDDACPGDPACNSGSAYLFRLEDTNWIEEVKLVASDALRGDHFGASTLLSGDVALVGYGGYIFTNDGLNWIERAKLPAPSDAANFGWTLAMSGENVLIGAPTTEVGAPLAGVAYMYRAFGEPDSDSDGINDYCQHDCNGNGIPDADDIASGTSQDCNENGVPDDCESDCNGNGLADECDIADGTSQDCAGNNIPDECEPDCNENGAADSCDIFDGTSEDCTGDGVPDECEPDCNGNGVADSCDITGPTSNDCNGNGVPDECDILGGSSEDCTGDGIPDECEPDCNLNETADSCDIDDGTAEDIDDDSIPDECENWFHCQTGEGYFDFGPHRVNLEAEQLAMHLTGLLRAPDAEYERILGDLQLVRDANPLISTVFDYPDYAPDQLMVKLDPEVAWEGYEALNVFYQVVEERTIIHDPPWKLITFCDNLNALVLPSEYTVVPEVLYAEPNWYLGDGDHITLTANGSTYRYTITHGFYDCMDGCDCGQEWLVDVDENGGVKWISYDEWGLWPDCFSDFVSCCVPNGVCGWTHDSNCDYLGGTAVAECLGDDDGDGLDGACTMPVVEAEGCRRIVVTPLPGTESVALLISSPDYPCVLGYIGEQGRIGDSPVYQTPQEWATVHVYGPEIVPNTTYEITGELSGGTYTDRAVAITYMWGDVVWEYGTVDFLDITAVVDCFRHLPAAPPIEWCDIVPGTPNGMVDFTDISYTVDAFRNYPYPFGLPDDCSD